MEEGSYHRQKEMNAFQIEKLIIGQKSMDFGHAIFKLSQISTIFKASILLTE